MGSTLATHEPVDESGPRALIAGFPPGTPGLDVSGWQVLNLSNWISIAANGARFAYVKATESTDYVSSQFAEQYTDSYRVGLFHGAYHFATPNTASGAAQATWFLNHGGQGSPDGRTMPPLLDIEYNPYGPTCYGLSPAAMVSWIADFSQTIHTRTGRLPAIYSTTNWWIQCTGNSSAFAAHPLFIARYPNNIASGPGPMPAGWSTYTLWQFASSGIFPGDQDVFNGGIRELESYGLTSSLVRTLDNATVYLVSEGYKYPISNMLILTALSRLGPVTYAPQSYLDQFATQQTAGRIIRGPEGTISFIDSGIKIPFTTCALVEDYGGSCAPSGYMQLTGIQSASFASGPAVTPFMNSAGGPLFYVQDGVKHEALDAASLANAGLIASANTLSPTALSDIPFAIPIVRDNVFAMRAGSSTGVLLLAGKASPIEPSAASLAGLPRNAVGTLRSESIAKLPAGAAFTGSYRSAADSSLSVVATGGLRPWPRGVGGAAFSPLTVPAAVTDIYPTAPEIHVGSTIKSALTRTVYLVMPDNIRPIGSWEALLALSPNATPAIVEVPQAIIASLPLGPVALQPGTLVRSSSSATVYLINGVTSKIPFSSFTPATEAGFTSFAFTSDDRLNAYPTSSSLLGFGVQCGSVRYVSAGGSLHALSTSTSGLYPFTFIQLDSFTCAIASRGTNATAFIRTPDGSIYLLRDGSKHAISSMEQFTKLAQGQTYVNVAVGFALGIPTGAPA